MIQSYNHPDIVNLSDGHVMVMNVTDSMMNNMWCRMGHKQREEFELVYGKESAFDFFVKEIRHADHKAAFFCGVDLTCIMWCDWIDVKGIGRCRVLGCVCSDYAIKHTVNFVRHSKEVRDAFMLFEPDDVKEIFVFITDDFRQSREWAARVCGFEEYSDASSKNGKFKMYRYEMNHCMKED